MLKAQPISQEYCTASSEEVSAKSRKLIKAFLEDEFSLEGVTDWEEVEKSVAALKPAILKSALQVRSPRPLPRTSPRYSRQTCLASLCRHDR